MKKPISWFIMPLILAVLIFNTVNTFAGNAKDLEVGITEHLDQYVPSDIMLTDHNGKLVNLKQLIDRKSVV